MSWLTDFDGGIAPSTVVEMGLPTMAMEDVRW